MVYGDLTDPAAVERIANDLAVRKGGVKDWKEATKFGVEVKRRTATPATSSTSPRMGSSPFFPETKEVVGDGKAPEWLHGLDLSCRKSDEKSFTKDTRKFGVEVYNDITTGT